jgi:hypothetical protein
MSPLTQKISDHTDICHECFKNFTTIGVIGIENGEVYSLYYCESCWNMIKRRPFTRKRKKVDAEPEEHRHDSNDDAT